MSPDVVASVIYTAVGSSMATFFITLMWQDGRRHRELRELRDAQARRDEERLTREREQREREMQQARERGAQERHDSLEGRVNDAQQKRWAAFENWKRSVDARLSVSTGLPLTTPEPGRPQSSID